MHTAQVDVADLGGVRFSRHEVLDKEIILEHTDLSNNAGSVGALLIAHHHGALN